MRTPTLALVGAALTLSLAACSPQPADPVDAPEGTAATDPADATTVPPAVDDATPVPAPAMEDPCNAANVQSLVGQEATEEVVEQARIDAGAQSARTLRPGQAVTMEFLEGRLNVDVDENGVITGLRCG